MPPFSPSLKPSLRSSTASSNSEENGVPPQAGDAVQQVADQEPISMNSSVSSTETIRPSGPRKLVKTSGATSRRMTAPAGDENVQVGISTDIESGAALIPKEKGKGKRRGGHRGTAGTAPPSEVNDQSNTSPASAGMPSVRGLPPLDANPVQNAVSTPLEGNEESRIPGDVDKKGKGKEDVQSKAKPRRKFKLGKRRAEEPRSPTAGLPPSLSRIPGPSNPGTSGRQSRQSLRPVDDVPLHIATPAGLAVNAESSVGDPVLTEIQNIEHSFRNQSLAGEEVGDEDDRNAEDALNRLRVSAGDFWRSITTDLCLSNGGHNRHGGPNMQVSESYRPLTPPALVGGDGPALGDVAFGSRFTLPPLPQRWNFNARSLFGFGTANSQANIASQTARIPALAPVGCIAPRILWLPAEELEASVSFYDGKHLHFWDQPDDVHIVYPAQLNLTVKEPEKFKDVPLALPSIRVIDIQCKAQLATKGVVYVHKDFIDPDVRYEVRYIGAKTRDEMGREVPLAPDNGITIEPKWYEMEHDGQSHANELGVAKRGWYLRFWVPFPTRLFLKRGTRVFAVQAQVWIGDDHGLVQGEEEEVSVSHLRAQREMAV